MEKNLIEVFIAFFREMIGDLGQFDEILEDVDYVWVLYSFFFVATILLTIAMLNLLIAIISDTFSRVKNAENLTKIWERWNIITEIDDLLFEKNKGKATAAVKETKKKFLIFIYNDCHFKKEMNDIEFKNSMIEYKENSKKTSDENFKKMDENYKKLEENFKKMEEKIEDHSKNLEVKIEKIFELLENSEKWKKTNKLEFP